MSEEDPSGPDGGLDGWPPARPLVVAHRGNAPGARENTLEGARRALLAGADALEVDVRVTADGVPVLHHDARLGGLPVAGTSAADLEARAAELGYRLARVCELLEAVGPATAVNLELKNAAAVEPTLSRVEAAAPRPVLLSGFDDAVAAAVDGDRAGLASGLVLGPGRLQRLLFSRRRRRRLEGWLSAGRPDVLVVHRSLRPLGLTGVLRGAGLPVLVWTVNRGRGLRRWARHPLVWGLVTDRPAAARRARSMATPRRAPGRRSPARTETI